MGQSKTLHGTELLLREIEERDITQQYVDWLNDPEVNRYLETRFEPQTLASVGSFVRSKVGSQSEILWAMCVDAGTRHIGNIKLGPINRHHRSADVSLFIGDKTQWGKGRAREAIALVTSYAFDALGLNKLRAGCYAENEGSARAFEKCGYQREGLLRGQVFCDGKEMGVITLGLLAREHLSTKRPVRP